MVEYKKSKNGHKDFYRRGVNTLLRKFEGLDVVGMLKGRGRLKKQQGEVYKYDMAYIQVTKDMTLYRKIWRTRISWKVS